MDLSLYVHYLQDGLQALGGLVIFATALVRIFPGKIDGPVGQASSYWSKIVAFLPTIGVNPQTQKIQEALQDQQTKK